MKVIVIGMSPYNMSSMSRINRWTLESLFFSGHDVLSLSWAYDCSYHIPNKDGSFYYEFVANSKKYQIPIIPLPKGISDPVAVYEVINQLEPDLVITIGDLFENSIMKALKTFAPNFKWLAVLTQSQFPVNEEFCELFDYMDGVLCSSESSMAEVSKFFKKSILDFAYVGSDSSFYQRKRKNSKFRIMTLGKISQADNLPMVIEVCKKAKEKISNLELYVHCNLYDNGEYQMETIRQRFDPEGQFIVFPNKFVSLIEGVSDEILAEEYSESDIFISAPLVSGTAMSVFEAIACGCFPLLSQSELHEEICERIADSFDGKLSKEHFLIKSSRLMTVGESYLNVPQPDAMYKLIIDTHKNKEMLAGDKEGIEVFSKKNTKQMFVQKILKFVTTLEKSNEVLCLESL